MLYWGIFTLHCTLILCGFPFLPFYLVGNSSSTFRCPTVPPVCCLNSPETSPHPRFISMQIARFSGHRSVIWLLNHGLPTHTQLHSSRELHLGFSHVNQWGFYLLVPLSCLQQGPHSFPAPVAAAASAPLPSSSPDPFG